MTALYSLLYGDSPSAFAKIVQFYFKPPIRALDLTYGSGHSWEKVETNTILGEIRVTSVDRDPESKAQFKTDLREIEKFSIGKDFNLVFYDPAWGTASTLNIRRKEFTGTEGAILLQQERVSNLAEVLECLNFINTTIPLLMAPNGRLIVKVMDVRVKGEFIPLHKNAIDILSNFKLFDIVLGVKNKKQALRMPWSLQNHIYYLIFNRMEAEN